MKKVNSKAGDYLAVPKKQYKNLRIDDFFKGADGRLDQSVLSPKAAAETYNFDFSSGALKDGLGVTGIGVAGLPVTNIWRFVKNIDNVGEIVMFSSLLGDVFYIKNGVQSLHITLPGRIYTANYRLHGTEVVLMWTENSPIAVWDGVNAAYFITDSPNIKSMDICGDFAFIAESDGQTIRYTDELDPINWNTDFGGGILTPAEGSGRVGKVMSLMGHLYVFKDFSVSRVSISGSGGVPKAAGNHIFGGRIFFDTVALCGNKIMFLSGDGLWEFDGLTAKKVLSNIAGIMPSESACAAYHGGRYHLAVQYAFGGVPVGCETANHLNNALITYVPSDGSYTLSRGMDITSMAAGDDAMYVVCGGNAGRLSPLAQVFSAPLLKLWKSPLSDLGSERIKFLREIHIDTAGAIVLTVDNGAESKSVQVDGSPQPQRVRVGMRGRKLSFCIESNETNACVARPVLVYSEV
ncbi:MAG: hypothetical protein FWE84_04655 [Firmicutes bacterium]|nr:hypothetical protein [Bacillota bacterium]